MERQFCSKSLKVCDEKCDQDPNNCEYKMTLDKFIEYCIENGINYDNISCTTDPLNDKEPEDFLSFLKQGVKEILKNVDIEDLRKMYDTEFKMRLLNMLDTVKRELMLKYFVMLSFDENENDYIAVRPSDVVSIRVSRLEENRYQVVLYLRDSEVVTHIVTKEKLKTLEKVLGVHHVYKINEEGEEYDG